MEECVTPDEEEDQKRIIREMKDMLHGMKKRMKDA